MEEGKGEKASQRETEEREKGEKQRRCLQQQHESIVYRVRSARGREGGSCEGRKLTRFILREWRRIDPGNREEVKKGRKEGMGVMGIEVGVEGEGSVLGLRYSYLIPKEEIIFDIARLKRDCAVKKDEAAGAAAQLRDGAGV